MAGFTPSIGFDLMAELRRARRAEIARIAAHANRLADRFGPAIAAGFLYCEILGRLPEAAEAAAAATRLGLSPSGAQTVIEELLAIKPGCAAGPDCPVPPADRA